MFEKRKAQRQSTNLGIEFKVAEWDSNQGQPAWVEAKGNIVDISDTGFGLTTPHLLHKGHVIMIKKCENPEVPLFGLVKWTGKQNDFYRDGFDYRYEE